MRKVYKELTQDQKNEGIIFTSTLSKYTKESFNDLTHEVKESDSDKDVRISRLLDDSFFDASPWRYNIVRR